MTNKKLAEEAIQLLKKLISIQSFSKEEEETASVIHDYLKNSGIEAERVGNNLIARNLHYEPELPTVLLNSHQDTVKPNKGYTMNPFEPVEKDGKLYGLGSNDAGGALVSLLMVFKSFYHSRLPFNLYFIASAEEEISGENGIALAIRKLPEISLAIVGEPTEMKLAVAEKGLIVLDCVMHGEAGHAARKNGRNAIELVLDDLQLLKNFRFDKVSETLGDINLSVTQINAGSQHNVIPDRCEFVVDVRTTDAYTNEEVVRIIDDAISSEVKPRSTRLQPSGIPADHPLVKLATELGIETFGSPTLSDQALMPFLSVKIGPGKSERSHTADEFIYISEIHQAIDLYRKLLNDLNLEK